MVNSEISQALVKAAALVRGAWCRGSLARDGKGRVTDVGSPKGVRFCPLGAMMKVCGDNPDLYKAVRDSFFRHTGYYPHEWNDGFAKNGRDCSDKLKEIAALIE